MLKYKIDRTWFSHLLQQLVRKWSGSILTTLEPAQHRAKGLSKKNLGPRGVNMYSYALHAEGRFKSYCVHRQ